MSGTMRDRLVREALEGFCVFRTSHGCPRRAVAYLEGKPSADPRDDGTIGGRISGLCEVHADQGTELGYRIRNGDGSVWVVREVQPA